MVDEEDCKEAFKLYDKEDSGVIAKEVSNPKKILWFWAQSVTSLKADLRQDINRGFEFSK